jgi:hypothetical protein
LAGLCGELGETRSRRNAVPGKPESLPRCFAIPPCAS